MSKKPKPLTLADLDKTSPIAADPELDQTGATIAALGDITAAYFERLRNRHVPENVVDSLTLAMGNALILTFLPDSRESAPADDDL